MFGAALCGYSTQAALVDPTVGAQENGFCLRNYLGGKFLCRLLTSFNLETIMKATPVNCLIASKCELLKYIHYYIGFFLKDGFRVQFKQTIFNKILKVKVEYFIHFTCRTFHNCYSLSHLQFCKIKIIKAFKYIFLALE